MRSLLKLLAASATETPPSLEERLQRIEWKLNVLLVGVVVLIAIPLLAAVWGVVKWGVLIVLAIAALLALAAFHERIFSGLANAWRKVREPFRTETHHPAHPVEGGHDSSQPPAAGDFRHQSTRSDPSSEAAHP